jgi:hypothetical protein
MNAKLFELKSTIKSLALVLHELSRKICEKQRTGIYAGSDQRHALAESRRCRHLLIAYGLLRGMDYEKIERPAKTNQPDWKTIESLKQEYAYVPEDVCSCA